MTDPRNQFLNAGGSNWGCFGCLGLLIVPVVIFGIWWAAQSLSGGGGDDDGPVAYDTCGSAMQAASLATSESDAEGHLRTSVGVCEDVPTWEAALREFPGAMGLSSADAVDPEFDLAGICAKYQSEPVCVDAASRGLDTYW